MAWEWSHTIEAYQTAEDNLRALDHDTLKVVFAEWVATYPRGTAVAELWRDDEWDSKRYERALVRADRLTADQLADFIWPLCEQLATCTNGGHRAYICPHGCHCVNFSDSE